MYFQLFSKLKKFKRWQRFGKNFYLLIHCKNVLDYKLVTKNFLLQKEDVKLHIFCLGMQNNIMGESNYA